MASKEATVFVVDVGESMSSSGDKAKALTILSNIIQKKIIAGRKGDHVGLLLVGTNESNNRLFSTPEEGYGNITEYFYSQSQDSDILQMPSLEFYKELENIPSNSSNGDMLDGIIVAIQMLQQHCVSASTGKPLKFAKKIYLFTDAKSDIEKDDESTNSTIAQLDMNDIKVVLCGFQFKSYDDEDEEENAFDLEKIIPETPKEENELYLRKFCSRKKEELGLYFDSDEALMAVQQMEAKQVRPVTLFRGSLTYGDTTLGDKEILSIPIWVYSKTAPVSLPTAKKLSKFSDSNTESETKRHSEIVYSERNYKYIGDDEIGDTKLNAINPTDLIRAYKYGKSYVPFSAEDEEASKLRTEKSMKIIKFASLSSISREFSMGKVLAVVPDQENTLAGHQFSAFIHALREKDAAAIVQYVSRTDTSPKIGALMYHKKGYGFFVQLPYADDVRYYNFPPIDFLTLPKINSKSYQMSAILPPERRLMSVESSRKHPLDTRTTDREVALQLVDGFIDAMDLRNAEDEHLFMPKRVFNPTYQHMYNQIFFRALHANDGSLLPLDPEVRALVEPLVDMAENAEHIAKKLKSAFDCKQVPPKAVKKGKEKSKAAPVQWSQLDLDRIDDIFDTQTDNKDSQAVKLEDTKNDVVVSVKEEPEKLDALDFLFD
ncbi:SPOC like C-terminal domain-containing protein [Globomyces pollinis-pini]|nr:SPOC like C-terminal domain-containing protein [Globomyces pollinis-pini]